MSQKMGVPPSVGTGEAFKKGKGQSHFLGDIHSNTPKVHLYRKGSQLGKRQALPFLCPELYLAPLHFSDSVPRGRNISDA